MLMKLKSVVVWFPLDLLNAPRAPQFLHSLFFRLCILKSSQRKTGGCHALFIFPELIQRWTPQYFCLSYDPFQPENKGVLMNRVHLCFVGQPFIALETAPSTSNNIKNISGTYKWTQNFQNLFPNRLILTDI